MPTKKIGSLEVRTQTRSELERIAFALDFIARHTPRHSTWLRQITRVIEVRPSACSSAWGCTTSYAPHTIYLAKSPDSIPAIELILTLLHESWHGGTDESGRWELKLPHRCRGQDCGLPHVRANDPIYAEEDKLRPGLELALFREGVPQNWTAPGLRVGPDLSVIEIIGLVALGAVAGAAFAAVAE